MNKLSKKMDSAAYRIYTVVLLVFAAATYLFCGNLYLALAEAAAAAALLVVGAVGDRRRQRELQRYIETVTYDSEESKNSAMTNFPLPMATFLLDSGRLVWGNQAFFTACGAERPSVGVYMADLVPNFKSQWLVEGKKRCPELMEVGGRRYQVSGSQIRGQGDGHTAGAMGITYWVDVTDYEDIKREYAASRPVVMIILLDNSARSAPRRTCETPSRTSSPSGSKKSGASGGGTTVTATSSCASAGTLTSSGRESSPSSTTCTPS